MNLNRILDLQPENEYSKLEFLRIFIGEFLYGTDIDPEWFAVAQDS